MISERNRQRRTLWLATSMIVMTALVLAPLASADDAVDPSAPKPNAIGPAVDSLPVFPLQQEPSELPKFAPADPGKPEDKMRAEALAWFMAAQVHYSRGEREEGLAALKRAVEKEPSSLAPFRALVPALLESGQTDEAKAEALKACQRTPKAAGLVQGVAVFLARTNRVPEAVALLDESLKALPEDKAFVEYLSTRRAMGALERLASHPDKAAEHYKVVFEALINPGDRLKPEELKDLLGDAGTTYDEFGQVFLLAKLPDLALKAFDEAAKHQTTRPGLHSYNLAQLFRQTQKPEQALSELEKYFGAQLQTKGRDAYQLLKDLLSDLSRQEELLGRLEKLHEADEENASLAYFLAEEYLAAGKLAEAKRTYENAPGANRDPRSLVGLSTIHRREMSYGKLLGTLTKAFQVIPIPDSPDEFPAGTDPELRLLSLALVSEMKSITGDAAAMDGLIKHAKTQQEADPPKLDFPEAYVMGKLCLDAERTDDAVSFYKLAISMQNQPSYRLYDEISQHLMRVEKYQSAISILEEGIQHPSLDEARWILQFQQCAAYEMIGETDKAISVIQEARKQQPGSPELHFREGWINYHAQRWDEAVRIFEEIVATGRERAGGDLLNRCRFSLSAIHVHLGDFDKGELILEDVLKSDPQNTQANNDLGYLWADRNKNLDKAKSMIEIALKAEPENSAYLDSMGWVLYRLEKYADAKEYLLKATKKPRGEVDSTIWDHLGDVQDKLGEKDEALQSWVKALESELGKPKPDEKLVKALKEKVPADRVPTPKKEDSEAKSS